MSPLALSRFRAGRSGGDGRAAARQPGRGERPGAGAEPCLHQQRHRPERRELPAAARAAEHPTIAQVLQANGVDVPLSCEMGICGACLTPVIDGVVDHRDSVQSEAEKSATDQQVALCCSRSHSGELVIGL